MNIQSSFSIFLYLLLLSAIQCYHWVDNTMYDLEYQGSSFDTEAASWTSSMPLVTPGVKTTQCGSDTLLGGYNIMGGASYNYGQWSRTYSDLPSHNTITFQGKFYMIDSWQTAYDHFHLYFEGINFQLWSVNSNYANYATADKCGNPSFQDLDPMTVYVTVPHTATTLKFAMANHFTGTSDLQSMGFRDIIMTFSTESPVPSLSYCGVTSGYPLSSYACSCGAGTSMTFPNSGVCGPCDPSCTTCNGAGPSMCTSCAAGEYLKDGSCYLCDSSCQTCNGAGSASCTSCADGKIFTNGICSCKESEYFYDYEKKCYPTCEFPFQIEIIDTIKFCRTDISLSLDEVLVIKKTAASFQATGEATSAGMKASSVINSNSPSSALLAGLSSMMQYIRYMKINFPPKVQMLFKVSAGNPISSSFGVHIPSVIKENLSDDPLPYAFDKYNINSNFVSNLWDFMVSLILMLLAILALVILKLMTKGYRRINMVVGRILQALKWNFPIMMICGSSGDIVFYASLQLRSSPFTGLSSTICCIVSILMMILVVLLLTMAFKIARTIRKGRQSLEQEKSNKPAKWKGFEILYVEYEENSFFSLAYMFLFLSRNIIFNLTLATLFEYPLVECCIINACNFMMISYLLYLRPLKDLLALVQLWVNEGLLNILSINVLILAILDYIEVQQKTTRNGMEETILVVIKTFNFAALAFMALGFLVFMRAAYRIWKTGRAKGMRSPLQMFNFLFFGDDDDEEKVVEKVKENEFSKKNLQIEKKFRENNNNQSTIDVKGETSLVNLNSDTTIIQDTSMKILQTEFIQREQITDFEMNHQVVIFSPQKMRQRGEVEKESQNMAGARIRKVQLKRRNRMLESPIEEVNNPGLKNDDAENKLWFSNLRKLKARLNENSNKTDLKIETNMMSLQ